MIVFIYMFSLWNKVCMELKQASLRQELTAELNPFEITIMNRLYVL